MSYSEEVLTAGARILEGRNFEFKLGRQHAGVERDRMTAVRHILDVTLPIVAAETPLTYGEQRSPQSSICASPVADTFTTTSDVGWGAY